MEEEPTPPATLPSAVVDSARNLGVGELRELAAFAETLADHRERESNEDDTDAGADNSGQDPVERPDAVPSRASVTVKTINENRYRYWQWREGETIKSKYIGPATQSE